MDCPICLESYNETNHQPNVLYPCGHTLCKECLKKLTSKKCALCNTVFTDFVPNWQLIQQFIQTRSADSVDQKTEFLEKLKKMQLEIDVLKSQYYKRKKFIIDENQIKTEQIRKKIENDRLNKVNAINKSAASLQKQIEEGFLNTQVLCNEQENLIRFEWNDFNEFEKLKNDLVQKTNELSNFQIDLKFKSLPIENKLNLIGEVQDQR